MISGTDLEIRSLRRRWVFGWLDATSCPKIL
jgi:hypothetical protein